MSLRPCWYWMPTASQAEVVGDAQRGDVHLELRVQLSKISEEFPRLGLGWNVVRQATLNAPEMVATLQTLTTAGIKGCRFIMQNPDEAAAILHERIPTIDLELAKRVVKDLNKDRIWGTGGGADLETAQFSAKLSEELGITKKSISVSSLIDERFVKVALRELGPEK